MGVLLIEAQLAPGPYGDIMPYPDEEASGALRLELLFWRFKSPEMVTGRGERKLADGPD